MKNKRNFNFDIQSISFEKLFKYDDMKFSQIEEKRIKEYKYWTKEIKKELENVLIKYHDL